jgi:hypothetical protein
MTPKNLLPFNKDSNLKVCLIYKIKKFIISSLLNI